MTDMSDGQPSADQDLVPGRGCDGCTMCCKLLDIDVLEKPRGVWCPHCDQKRGCKIYERRPDPCRGFHCGYLRIAHLDERWKPSKAKFLINYEAHANRIAIHADPARPDAWREEPFYSTIKSWARRSAGDGGTVVVWAGANVTVVMPDRDKCLGTARADQFILLVQRQTARGVESDYELVDADDERVNG